MMSFSDFVHDDLLLGFCIAVTGCGMGGVKVLRLTVPDYVELDEYEARLLLAIELYREARLTLKQAAELAGFCVEDFMRELSRRRVSVINLDEEELREELRVAEELAGGARG